MYEEDKSILDYDDLNYLFWLSNLLFYFLYLTKIYSLI